MWGRGGHGSQVPGHLTEGDTDIEENPDRPGAVAYKHHVCLSFSSVSSYLLQYHNLFFLKKRTPWITLVFESAFLTA